RDFTFVQDIVDANIAAATRDVSPGSVFNISGGSNVSVNDVLSTLTRIHGAALKLANLPPVPGDVWRTGGDSEAASATLGWSPRVTIADGLEQHYRWAKETFKGR